MSKVALTIVYECGECIWFRGGDQTCGHESLDEPVIEDMDTIPEWCPLPDAKEPEQPTE